MYNKSKERRNMKRCLYEKCNNFVKRNGKKYCSYSCWIKHKEELCRETRNCLWCEKEFETRKKENKAFCTIGCARRYLHNGEMSFREYKKTNKVRHYVGGYINRHGYVCLWKPDHLKACRGYVYEHRYIMEKHLGRFLSKNEIVHHIDGNKSNNELSNLSVVTRQQHRALIYANIKCPHCNKTFCYEDIPNKTRNYEEKLEGL